MRIAPKIVLTAAEEKALAKLSRSNTTSVRLARRAKIVLLAARGKDNQQIAEELGVGRVQVGRWRERYAAAGLVGIEQDVPRGGRHPTVDAQAIVRLATQTTPDNAGQRHALEHAYPGPRWRMSVPRPCGGYGARTD